MGHHLQTAEVRNESIRGISKGYFRVICIKFDDI